MSHITQPAPTTAMMNIEKQYRPYRIIAFVVERCVMPKTTEAKNAKSSTAAK